MGLDLYKKLETKDKRFLIYSAIFTALYIFPIIHANFYYKEDLTRVTGGGFWFWNGRLVTSAMYWLLNFGYNTKDIAPFPQILGGVFLFCSTFFVYRLLFSSFSPFIAALCAFFFFAHPFYLTNLSYRYDALGMDGALLLAAWSAYVLFYKSHKKWWYSMGLLLLSLLMYQVALSVFVGLGLLLFVSHLSDPLVKSWKQLLEFVGVSLGAYVLYSFITLPFLDGWIASKTMVSINMQGIRQILENIQNAWSFFWQVFEDPYTWGLFLFPFILGWVYSIFEFFTQYKSHKSLYKISLTGFIALVPVFLFFVMLLPIFPLEEPLIHSRIFMGFCILLLYTCIYWVRFTATLKAPRLKFLIFLPFLYYLMASYSYSNAQAIQKDWEDNLTREIIADLREAKVLNQIHTIVVSGREPFGAGVQNILKKYPVFTDSIIRNLDEEDPRATYFLLKFPLLEIHEMYRYHFLPEKLTSQATLLKKAPVIAKNRLYTLRIWKDILFIEYPKGELQTFLKKMKYLPL